MSFLCLGIDGRLLDFQHSVCEIREAGDNNVDGIFTLQLIHPWRAAIFSCPFEFYLFRDSLLSTRGALLLHPTLNARHS